MVFSLSKVPTSAGSAVIPRFSDETRKFSLRKASKSAGSAVILRFLIKKTDSLRKTLKSAGLVVILKSSNEKGKCGRMKEAC